MQPEPEYWPAPVADGPVAATVSVPGSKSIANRALVLAALSDGVSRIDNLPSGSRDLALMVAALQELGSSIDSAGAQVTVRPAAAEGAVAVDCGLAGTVMRFVPPVAALTGATATFDGDPRARVRPMGPMIMAMRQLGIRVDDHDTGRLPFDVTGTGRVPGGAVTVDASSTSQFVTALLLSGARFDRGVDIRHSGAPVPSLPHIAMTVRMLSEHGVTTLVEVEDRSDARWTVPPGTLRPRDRAIEPDLSNAAPFVALAAITGGRVIIPDWPADSLQPAGPMIETFETLGAAFAPGPTGMTVTGTGRIRGLHADLRDLGELVPTVAAVAAFADSPSHLMGIGHIAGHETDRLAALAEELSGLGCRTHADSEGLWIEPGPLRGGRWRTYADHRMATCGAILGARVPGVQIEDISTTGKTFPGFADAWTAAVATSGGAV
ncbi:MAG: 3-phosphoshikimate 1-carboxyvinyltransferase [Candidatus Nanopelagicales bacterium]